MTVKELVEFLKNQPQELRVCYKCCSEYSLLEEKDIELKDLQPPRDGDGWVADLWGREKDELETEKYLVLPGN